jgi:hypothetical protein
MKSALFCEIPVPRPWQTIDLMGRYVLPEFD